MIRIKNGLKIFEGIQENMRKKMPPDAPAETLPSVYRIWDYFPPRQGFSVLTCPSSPRTHSLDLADLELSNPDVSAF